MEDHIFFELKLSNFGFPTDKRGKVIIVDKKVKDSLSFRQMYKLRDLCSENGFKISIIISLNGRANSPD